MIDTRAVGQELQDLQHQIVDRIRKRQQTVTGAIKAWAHAAQTVRPQVPALPKTALTDKLPSRSTLTARLPKPEEIAARLPKPEEIMARLPKPEEIMAGTQEFAGQLIAAQRKLAGQVTHAAMPLARQGAAIFGQAVSQPGWSKARTTRHAMSARPAAKAGSAETSSVSAKPAPDKAKATAAKPAASRAASAPAAASAADGTPAKKTRSAKK